MANLIIKDSNGIREVTLETLNSVGRSPANQVQISDPLVSKQHCLIFADQYGNYSIKDLGSRNGELCQQKACRGRHKSSKWRRDLTGRDILHVPSRDGGQPGGAG